MENINHFVSNGGRLVIQRLPELEFFIKSATIPSISVPPVRRPSQLTSVPEQGDAMIQSPLEITVYLDEDAKNYIETYNWMKAYSTPEQLINYNKASLTQQTQLLRSDITLTLMSLKNNPKLEFTFKDAFPTDMTSLDINIVEEDTMRFTFGVTFEYTKPFSIIRL